MKPIRILSSFMYHPRFATLRTVTATKFPVRWPIPVTITNYYGVSYVDLYSGVLIHEDNANAYLEDDGITPNKKARELIADRLITVLKNRF